MRHLLICAVGLMVTVASTATATPLDLMRTRAKSSVAKVAADGPLSRRDVGLYRRIFAHQEAGHWDRADALIGQLGDPILLGHVQWQRYMHPSAYRSTFEELSAWLEEYGDLPGADRVYRLAERRRPNGAPPPPRPVPGYLGGSGQERQEIIDVAYHSARERTAEEAAQVRTLRETVEKLARRRQPEAAFEHLQAAQAARLLDPTEMDLARWDVARAYLAVGDDLDALKLARLAAARSGDTVPEIHWTAGIAAWRHGRIDLATVHFRTLALAEDADPSERTRAAFWAARAYVIAQKPQEVGHFLRIAAEEAYTFYGLLACAVLGEDGGRDWAEDEVGDDIVRAARDLPAVRRALALSQLGRDDLAEREIRKLAARADSELMEGLIVIAGTLELPAAQMRMAQSLRHREGLDDHEALYPVPTWQPVSGFTVDRALLFAVMRAESGFDPAAESHAGARGVMQVMPATAREIAARAKLELTDGAGLFEPATGIMVGQAYLDEILGLPGIDDNLMLAAVAYNAGPGRVAQWRRGLDLDHDPLLFLESIPLPETRIYVKKVLTNFWNYRDRLGQPRPSLGALAGNTWPIYRALDAGPELHAWN